MRTPRRLGLVAAGVAGIVATTLAVVPRLDHDPSDPAEDLRSRAGEVLTAPSGATRFVGTEPGRPIALSTTDPAEAADEFTDRYGPALGAGATDLVPVRTTPSLTGGTAVRYQQEVDGVPVFGAQTSVQVDADGRVLSSFADLSSRAASAPTAVTIAPRSAVGTALDEVAAATGAPRSALSASRPVPRVYDPLVVGGDPDGEVRRTWFVEVTATTPPVRHLVLVDAATGAVALSFSQLTDVGALSREVCDFANVPIADERCTAPVRTEGGPVHAVADVNHAYDHSGTAYQWFEAEFGRQGPADDGAPLRSTVRYCDPVQVCPYANAFWNGEQLTFGAGYPTDDVTAHEFAHGVTEFTADLYYWYQSGAINESMSDVFGELVDLAHGTDDTSANRWLVGEDLPGGPLRDMADPPAFGDPDSTVHPAYAPGPGDEGGVHANSGVANKAAALLTDGGTFGGYTVDPLGPDKVATLHYEVLTTMLTSASDFQDLHAALPQACANLVTAETHAFTVADCLEVRDAVDAVQMNVVPPAAAATDVPVCADGDPVVDVFSDDLESTHDGRWSFPTPIGVFRWAYQSEAAFSYATSGTQGLWGPTLGTRADRIAVTTSPIALPDNGHPVLHFRHAYGFEVSGGQPRDGGVVEYSTTGPGGPWIDLGPHFVANGYPSGLLAASGNNPLKGRPAFHSESRGYLSSRADLSSLSGQSVLLRFRVGENGSGSGRGWFVDDIRVADCANPDLTVTQIAERSSVVVGDDIDLHLTLHNTGNVALTDVTVSNPEVPDCETSIPTLAPDEAQVVDCTYTTVDPDDLGTWTNTPTVTATELPPQGVTANTVAVEVETPAPAVALEQTVDRDWVTAGQDIGLHVTVSNTGNVTLTGVELDVPEAPGCSGPVADVPVGAAPVVDCTYTTVAPDDLGTWTSTATVTADQLPQPTAADPVSVDVLAPGSPRLAVDHASEATSVAAGEPVDLTVTVTNTGNVSLSGVTITAPDAPDCARTLTQPIPVDGQKVVACHHAPTEAGTWSSTVSVTSAQIPTPVTSPTVEVTVLDVTDPLVQLTSPADGAVYDQGEVVLAEYSCTDEQPVPPACVGRIDGSTAVAAGMPVDTTTPGPHTFTVTATDGAGNVAEAAHTYTVVVRRPDGRIRQGAAGATVGDNRYNTTGVGQNRVARVARGKQVNFFVTAQNDGSQAEALRVRGQRSTSHYTVRYFSGGQDITTKITNGTYSTPVLAPGAIRTIKVVVTVGRAAPAGGKVDRRVTTTSTSDPGRLDVVRFVVKRR